MGGKKRGGNSLTKYYNKYKAMVNKIYVLPSMSKFWEEAQMLKKKKKIDTEPLKAGMVKIL